MRKYFTELLLILGLLFAGIDLAGQSHGWTVNPSDYENDCEVNAMILWGTDEVTKGTLGAFVGTTCRGFADGFLFTLTGKTIFSIRCYSNVLSGETLTFKYFDPSDNSYHDINETVGFIDGTQQGNAVVPLIFHITVCDPVTIGTQPSDNNICEDSGSTSFSVLANGTAPFIYQWQYLNGPVWENVTGGSPAGAVYSGAATATLGVSGITSSGSYQYRCQISNCSSANNVTSAPATLTVNSAAARPNITTSGPTTFCAGGNVTLTSSAGTTYLWSNGATAQSINVTTSGSYTVRITNASGCQSPVSDPVVVAVNTVPAAPTITASGPVTFCAGGSVNLTSSAGTTYLWSTGATTQSINVTTPGTYTVRITNASGCQSPASTPTNVTVNPLPGVSAGNDASIANGTSAALNGTVTGTGPFTYSWTPASLLVNASVEDPVTVNLTSTTTFTFIATINATGCSNSDNVTISVSGGALNSSPTATPGTICAGESVQLNAMASGGSGTYTYTWSSIPGGFTSSLANPVATPSISTTYLVEVNDGFSTVDRQVSVTVNSLPASPTITPSGPTTFCSGSSVTLISSAGATYLWSTGATTQSINVTIPGSYTVQVTNSGGCESPVSLPVAVTVNTLPPAPTITPSGPTTYCTGGNVNLTSSAGTTYLWSTGAITQSINVSTPGSYTVRITNSNGCQSPASAATVVTVNPLPGVNAGNDASIANGTSTTLNGTVTGTGPFTYSWTPASLLVNAAVEDPVTVNLTSTTTFTFMATINATGCSSSDNVTISVMGGALNASPTATPGAICTGETVQLDAAAVGGSGNYTYLWSSVPAGFSSTLAKPVATPSISTTYYVAVNDGFSTVNRQIAVTVNPLPGVNAGSDASIANGTSTTLNGTVTGTGPFTYSWTPASLLVNAAVEDPVTVNLTSNATFTFTATITATGCSNSDNVTISVSGGALNASPTSTPGTICAGETIQLDAAASGGSGTYTYLWSSVPAGFSSTLAKPTATPAVSTVYYIAVNDGFSTVNRQVTVIVNPLPARPSISPSGPLAFCAGGSVTLTSSSATTYLWSTEATTHSINVNTSGTFTVRVKNSAGCESQLSEPITVTVNDLPLAPTIISSGSTTICAGGSVTLTSSPGATYLWSTGATTQNINVTTAGSYTVRIASSAGCQSPSSAATVVTVNPNPGVNAGPDASIPNGTSTSLNGTVTGTGPFTYSWTPVSLLVNATLVDPVTVNLTSTTTFTLTATITATGCQASDAVTVSVTGGALNANPTATPGSVCAGSNVQLDAAASGGSGTYTYSWTSVPAGFTSTVAKPVVAPEVNTIYTVVVNDGFSTVGRQVPVTVNAIPPGPSITASGPVTFCIGGNVTLTSSSATNYLWSTGATSRSITVTSSGIYTVRVRNAAGCLSEPSPSTTVTVRPLPASPLIDSTGHPTCTSATGIVRLAGLPETGIWTLTRYAGGITTSGTGTITTVTGLPTGTYNFTVRDESGCTSLVSSNVIINTQPPTPSAPVVGTITHPTYTVPTGSVVLTGLPTPGTWRLTRYPGAAIINGSGSSRTVSGLEPGIYTFTVTNAVGCVSASSASVLINARPGPPTVIITNPDTICSISTADLTLPAVTAGSDPNLKYSYWMDADTTQRIATPSAVPPGVYYIKGSTTANYYTIKPVTVIADQLPIADAGPDQTLEYTFNTTLDALFPELGSGIWSVETGTGTFASIRYAKSKVTELSLGRNEFIWTVTNGVCPPVSDKVVVTVNDLKVPTLITPNRDGRNDFFNLQGIQNLGKTELTVFDRRGFKVYETKNYLNDWEGLDYNGNELPEDTYFWTIITENGKSLSGFVVIRR